MATKYSTDYLLQLIEASDALSTEKKAWWEQNLTRLDEVKRIKLANILEKELRSKEKMLHSILTAKKIRARKKLQAVYGYVEKRIAKEEEIELAALDEELANLPD